MVYLFRSVVNTGNRIFLMLRESDAAELSNGRTSV